MRRRWSPGPPENHPGGTHEHPVHPPSRPAPPGPQPPRPARRNRRRRRRPEPGRLRQGQEERLPGRFQDRHRRHPRLLPRLGGPPEGLHLRDRLHPQGRHLRGRRRPGQQARPDQGRAPGRRRLRHRQHLRHPRPRPGRHRHLRHRHPAQGRRELRRRRHPGPGAHRCRRRLPQHRHRLLHRQGPDAPRHLRGPHQTRVQGPARGHQPHELLTRHGLAVGHHRALRRRLLRRLLEAAHGQRRPDRRGLERRLRDRLLRQR